MQLLHMVLCGLGIVGAIGIAYLPFSGQLTQRLPESNQRHDTPPRQLSAPEQRIIAEMARQLTVRVLTDAGLGSGVLIDRQENTYTVLTCEHVIATETNDRYMVLTADGVTHPARRLTILTLAQLDLALLEFESATAYRVAVLGNSNELAEGDRVYASGFPNYHFANEQNRIESTREWGTRAYELTTGEVSLLLDQILLGGYRLGYTNDIEQGMSGGPVLDAVGHLVGITGRLKHPLQGIEAYTFVDGTRPSEALFQRMEALSWAIPIASFQEAVSQSSNSRLNSKD